jgi:DNA repair exonuclease SbcCD ATPase subunit
MDLDALREKIDAEDFESLTSYVSDLESQLKTAREDSIKTQKKAETRIKELKNETKSLTDMQSELFTRLGIEKIDDLETLDPKGHAEAAKQYEAKLKRAETDLKEKMEALAALEDKHRTVVKNHALKSALGEHEWIDADLVASFVSARTVLDDDDVRYRADDGLLQSLSDGLKTLAKEKPHLLKKKAPAGSGYHPDAGGADVTTKTLDRSQFDTLSAKQRMEFIKSGGTLASSANR